MEYISVDRLRSSGIKNLLIDLGGVLVTIDFLRMSRAFESIGLVGLDALYNHSQQQVLFDKFDRGEISESNFRRELLNYFGKNKISDEQFDHAWNSIIVDVPPAVPACLSKLRNHFQLYLLSNTNSIHIRYLGKLIAEQHGIQNFEILFDRVYYSFRLGSRKPEQQIYQRVLVDAQINPHETLFIDDTSKNIDAALMLGFNVYLMPQGMLLPDVMRWD